MFQNNENKKQECQINNRIQNNQRKTSKKRKVSLKQKNHFFYEIIFLLQTKWEGSGLWTHPYRAGLFPVSPSGVVSLVLGWGGNTPPPLPPSSPSSSSTSGSRALTSQWALTSNPSTSTSSPTAVMSPSVGLARQLLLNSWRRAREEATPPVSSAGGKGLVTCFPSSSDRVQLCVYNWSV